MFKDSNESPLWDIVKKILMHDITNKKNSSFWGEIATCQLYTGGHNILTILKINSITHIFISYSVTPPPPQLQCWSIITAGLPALHNIEIGGKGVHVWWLGLDYSKYVKIC